MSINIVRTDSSDPFKVKLPLGIHIVGKDKLDCFDPRVNKNHAQLDLLNDKIIIKPLTKKPCFVKKTGTVDHETVHSGSTVTLNVGDQFGLLPDCYWYEFIPLNDEIDASATIIDTMENNVNSLTTTENYSLTTTVKIEQPDSPTSSADEDIESSAHTSLLKRRLESRDNHVTDVVKKIKKEVDTDNVEASEGNVERHQKPDSTVTVFVKSEFGVDCETGNPVDHHFDLPPIVHSTESREEMQNRTVTNGVTQRYKIDVKGEPVDAKDPLMNKEMVIHTDKPENEQKENNAKATRSSQRGKAKTRSTVVKSKRREAKKNDETETNKKLRYSNEKGDLLDVQDPLMDIEMVVNMNKPEIEDISMAPIKREHSKSSDEQNQREIGESPATTSTSKRRERKTRLTAVKSKKQTKQISKVDSTRRSVKKKAKTNDETMTNRTLQNSNGKGELEDVQDPLMDVHMAIDIDKPEVEHITNNMLPIKREFDESSDEYSSDDSSSSRGSYDPREIENEKTSSSEDEECRKAVNNKRGKAKTRTTRAKSKKQNKQKKTATEAKKEPKPIEKRERKWSYYSDSNMPESPVDPYGSDSDSDGWQPQLNIPYVQKIQSAIGKNKPFWFCPDNFYKDY